MTDTTYNDVTRAEWRKIRKACIARDYKKCYRCEKKGGKNNQQLSVHHIVPRNEGGATELPNLITLCTECHDLVEIAGYRTLAEISCVDGLGIEPKPKAVLGQSNRPDWHQWVYGGARRPQ